MRCLPLAVLVLVVTASAQAMEPAATPEPVATPEPTPVAPSLEEIQAQRERTNRETAQIMEMLYAIKVWGEDVEKQKARRSK